MEVVLPLVRAVADDVVSVEVGDDASGGGFGQVADAVIGHGDCRGGTVVVITSRDIARTDATNVQDLLQQELSGVEFSYSLLSSWFTKVNYIGAFNVGDNWLQGWTNFDPENTDY